MKEFLTAWSPRVLSVLRIITGFLFLWHGSQKLFHFPPYPIGTEIPPRAFLIFAGGLEFFGGLLIVIGLFTRPIAFILSGMMAVGYFIVHAPRGFIPLINGGEPAVLYCFVFLYLAFAGAGIWSMDEVIAKNRRPNE
ncbi:MAG: DoxX family protein [Pyrinomonadaceae bacterium]